MHNLDVQFWFANDLECLMQCFGNIPSAELAAYVL